MKSQVFIIWLFSFTSFIDACERLKAHELVRTGKPDQSTKQTSSVRIKKEKVNLLQTNTAMGAAKPIVQEITQYLGQLNTEQQKAVLTVVKTFAKEESWWNDKKYIAEMDRRFAELESGKVKGITLDELEAGARRSFKNRKQKKQ